MRYPYPPHLVLPRSATRFARKHSIALTGNDGDAVAELERVLLTPAYAHLRGRWLERVWKNARRRGIEKPVLSRGHSNPAVRLLAAEGLTPGEVLEADRASRTVVRWDRELRRVLGVPTDPAWRYRWWADRSKQYQVILAFAGDGSAIIGYSAPCDRKCANAGQSRPPRTLHAQESTNANATLLGDATAGATPHSATRAAGVGGVA